MNASIDFECDCTAMRAAFSLLIMETAMANGRPVWYGIDYSWSLELPHGHILIFMLKRGWYGKLWPLQQEAQPLAATTEADAKAEALAMARRVVAELADAIGRAG